MLTRYVMCTLVSKDRPFMTNSFVYTKVYIATCVHIVHRDDKLDFYINVYGMLLHGMILHGMILHV